MYCTHTVKITKCQLANIIIVLNDLALYYPSLLFRYIHVQGHLYFHMSKFSIINEGSSTDSEIFDNFSIKLIYSFFSLRYKYVHNTQIQTTRAVAF